jgi:hypothetical protein
LGEDRCNAARKGYRSRHCTTDRFESARPSSRNCHCRRGQSNAGLSFSAAFGKVVDMGTLVAIALSALLLLGLLWKPGLSLSALGLLVVGLGLMPHVEGPPLVELDAFKRVLGVGSNPPVIAGLFILGFGRLVMLVQKIANRPPAPVVPDDGYSRSRRDPALSRRDDRL